MNVMITSVFLVKKTISLTVLFSSVSKIHLNVKIIIELFLTKHLMEQFKVFAKKHARSIKV